MRTTLISTTDLASHTAHPDWLIVDCRFDLARPAAGEEAYQLGHIPGAVYAHLDRDLSSAITPASGRHPLPSPQQFAATLSRWGVTSSTQVVAYDADVGAYAARLWWLLRWVGHSSVAVLDGGLKAWQSAGLPVTTAIPVRTPTQFAARPDPNAWLTAADVAERVLVRQKSSLLPDASEGSRPLSTGERADWRLLDARAPERFAGEVEPLDTVAGHVPGARNHPFATSIGLDGRFLPAAELRMSFERSQSGAADSHTIAMCGSGVTACHLLLALEVAGKPGAKLYAGSWSEWIRDPARPVAKGVTR